MAIIWPVIIVFSIVYGLLTGRIEAISTKILELPQQALTLVFAIITTSCFWTGLMYVMQDTGMIKWLSKALHPFIKLVFPTLEDEEAIGYLSANIAANIFGLGFAATPSGLKGFKRLQEISPLPKDTASDDMIAFLVLNTTGLTLIPTTVMAVRLSLGAKNPADFVALAIICTVLSTIMGVIAERVIRNYAKHR